MNRFLTTTVLSRALFTGLLCVFPLASIQAQMPELPEPTENHKLLHKDAGTWDATMKLYLPGSEPMESKGVEVNEVVCNGLWTRSHFKGEFMGMPFEGSGMTGYSEKSKKFVGYWGDNMSSNPSTMEGEYDADSKSFTFQVTSIDPNTGEESVAKHVIVHNDDNTRTFTIYMGEEKMMDIVYKKRKGASSGSSKR